jgi:hypothetical protein
MKNSFYVLILIIAACAIQNAQGQIAAGLQLSNGADNNPNLTPQGTKDVVGTNGLYLQDTVRTGASFLLPSYTFSYYSFSKTPKENFLIHNIDVGWHHPTYFMSDRVRRMHDSAANTEALSDQSDTSGASDSSDSSEEESDDPPKDAIASELRGIAEAIFSGGYDTGAAPDTSSPADTAAADTTGASDEAADDPEAADSATSSSTVSPTSTVSAVSADTARVTPADSLQSALSDLMNFVADSIDFNDGSVPIMQWAAGQARTVERALLDAFDTDSAAIQIRDSIEVTIRHLAAYIPPPVDTSAIKSVGPAHVSEDVPKHKEEEPDFTVPLSLPRTPISDWSWSDLSLTTDEDDTASYELEVGAAFERRAESGNNKDSVGSSTPTLRVQAHQAFGGRLFNVAERFELTSYKYAAYSNLDNMQLFPRLQARWQPTERFTVIGEAAYGYRNYANQQIDTQVIKGKQYEIKAAQNATIATYGIGAFFRIAEPTAVGAMIQGSAAPQGSSSARVSVNTYYARRKGAPDLSDDLFTHTGIEGLAIVKHDLGWDTEIGAHAGYSAYTFNQYALTEVVVKGKKLVVTLLKTSNELREDNVRSGELSIAKTFAFENFPLSSLVVQLLAGYNEARSNDPNFTYHDGYVMLNVNVDM